MLWLLACASGTNYPAGLVGDRHDPRDDSAAVDTSDDTSPAGDSALDSGADTAVDTGSDTGEIQGDLCAPVLPDTTQVVRGDVTLEGDGLVAWVCRGDTLSVAGDDGRYFVDDRAALVISGTGGRAWVLGTARVSVYGNVNELFVEEGADVHVEAEGVAVTTCTTLTFVGGPADGC